MLLSVVYDGITLLTNRNRHILQRKNLSEVLLYTEDYIREVRISISELCWVELHTVLAYVGSTYHRITRIGDRGDLIQLIIGSDLITGHLMLGTIIDKWLRILGDGYHRVFTRVNHHVTLYDNKADRVEIAIDIDKVWCIQTHLIKTCVDTAYNIIARELEVGQGISVIIDGDLIASDLLSLTIVNESINMTRDGYHHRLVWFDHQWIILNDELYIIKVLIDVLEVTLLQLHWIVTDGSTTSCVLSIEDEVTLLI